MNILLINKFLYPRGGAETYLLKLGKALAGAGHAVSYFGMAHPDNCVGNRAGLYTKQLDFHDGSSPIEKLTYPLRIIRSGEAKTKLRAVMEDFRPDVVHINNFNYQLTPTVLEAAEEYRRENNPALRVVYTAHDSQLVCPGHLMYRPDTHTVCDACLGHHPWNCVKRRCIHGSRLRSLLGAIESEYWYRKKIYAVLDAVICPSADMKRALDTDPTLRARTVVLRNFVEKPQMPLSTETETPPPVPSDRYVLYFGRYAEEKGIRTLLSACRALPDVPFIFAGSGELKTLIAGEHLPNVRDVGFLSGENLDTLVRGARFTVCMSECSENCPFSVMESIMHGTPVLGSDRGGIPELIDDGKTGWLCPAGDCDALAEKIRTLWDGDMPEMCRENCTPETFDDMETYLGKLMGIYRG
ncbi:MAG: glycosyltransferase [Clostridia bacterium]|nr:glycosyltransferase [Clostridia bacterium]